MGLTIEQGEALVKDGWETFSDKTLVGIESLADVLIERDELRRRLEEARIAGDKENDYWEEKLDHANNRIEELQAQAREQWPR